MKYLRICTAIVLVFAAVGGLVFSLLSMIAVHDAATTLSTQSKDVLDSTQEAVVFLKRSTVKTQGLLTETKTRVNALDGTLEDVAAKVKNSPTGKTPLTALDERVAKQLQRAQVNLAALRSTLDGFQNTLVLLNSVQGFAKSDTSDKQGELGETMELSRSLLEASEGLDQVSWFLNEVLTDREVTQKSLTEVIVWVKRIEAKLDDAENRVAVFGQRLSVTEARIAHSQKAIPQGIEKLSLYTIILLACFAFTQIGLLLQARSLLGKSDT